MNRRTLLKTAGAILLCSSMPGIAEAANWIALGQRRARGSTSGGSVRFPVSGDQFRQFRLSVSGGAAKIEAIEIRLTDGSRQRVDLNRQVGPGGYSPSVSLAGGSHAVRFIEVRYGKYSDGRGGTYLHLWGKA